MPRGCRDEKRGGSSRPFWQEPFWTELSARVAGVRQIAAARLAAARRACAAALATAAAAGLARTRGTCSTGAASSTCSSTRRARGRATGASKWRCLVAFFHASERQRNRTDGDQHKPGTYSGHSFHLSHPKVMERGSRARRSIDTFRTHDKASLAAQVSEIGITPRIRQRGIAHALHAARAARRQNKVTSGLRQSTTAPTLAALRMDPAKRARERETRGSAPRSSSRHLLLAHRQIQLHEIQRARHGNRRVR